MHQDEFRAFRDAHRWRYASSMPQWPHEYVTRPKARDEIEFEAAVQFIRENGEHRRFKAFKYSAGYVRLYLPLDGYHYWTMGAPVEETTVINRAKDPNLAELLTTSEVAMLRFRRVA